MINLYNIYGPADEPIDGVTEFLYDLMKERNPEINISHSTLPTFDEHIHFVRGRPFRCWYLIAYRSEWAGYISATHNNEIGIVLRKAFRGKGIGPEAIQMFIDVFSPLPASPSCRNGNWVANIAPGNSHSRHVFEKLGFEIIQHTLVYKGR